MSEDSQLEDLKNEIANLKRIGFFLLLAQFFVIGLLFTAGFPESNFLSVFSSESGQTLGFFAVVAVYVASKHF